MELISSLQNPKIREAVRLHTSRGRKQQNRIIVFGVREIRRAIDAGIEFESFFICHKMTDSKNVSSLATHKNVNVFSVTEAVFDKVCYGSRAEGVVGVAKRVDVSLKSFRPSGGIVLVAESVEKPGNLGAIFRSADAAGAGGVIIADSVCDMFHPNVIRNSTGTCFSVASAIANSNETISWLRDQGYRILLATPQNAQSLYKIKLISKCAIVVGSEAKGLSNTWMATDFTRVCLPMSGVADSLNVSVTAAVMLYEIRRQLGNGN